jgi:glutamyl-tRNA(Gln) amidotransferase subunit E
MTQINYLSDDEYKKLGFRCGLEVHQQLDTKEKLFCHCPVGLTNREPDMKILRHMRPTLSELGEYDRTALMEFKTKKNVIYQLFNSSTCTYEMDDTPPFPLNLEALKIAIEIALLLNLKLVDEVHVTRKQYLDGSIPTGFQRTAIIGVDGWIPYKGRKIRIAALTLEEDSCREVSDIGHTITWKTDRLSTPLVEVITQPDILTPAEVPEVNKLIGDLLRATGKVRRGIGATRQDVNVSITGGTRVEIKGVPQLGWHKALTHIEAMRQNALLELAELLKEKGLNEKNILNSSKDLTEVLKETDSYILSKVIKDGGSVSGLAFAKCDGVYNFPVQPGVTFAEEVSGRVRVVACIDTIPNLLHSDEPGVTGFLNKEWEMIRAELNANDDDLIVILFGDHDDVEMATSEVIDRMHEALIGVAVETRQPYESGITRFERILPGADRMYPDTDTPPTRVEQELVEEIRADLPQYPWDRQAKYLDMRLNDQIAYKLSRSVANDVFELIVAETKIDPSLAAHLLLRIASDLRPMTPFSDLGGADWIWAFTQLDAGNISREGLSLVIEYACDHGLSAKGACEMMNLNILSEENLALEVAQVVKDHSGSKLEPLSQLLFLVGKLRQKIGGRFDGQKIALLMQGEIAKAAK